MRASALAKTLVENGARRVVGHASTPRVVAPGARAPPPRARRMRVQASPVTGAPAPPSTPRFTSDITADGVDALVTTIVSEYERALRDAARGTTWESTFSTTLRALGRASEASAAATLPAMTHRERDVREASTKAKDKLKAMFDGTFARREVYEAMKAVGADAAPTSEARRASEYLMREFERNGAALSAEKQEVLMSKLGEIEALCSSFCAALNEDATCVEFAEAELDGVDVSAYAQGEMEGTRRVGLIAPDIMPVLQFARRASTRKRMAEAKAKQCQDVNTDRFLRVIELRNECAQMLGYASHAEYMLKPKMASTPARAEAFLRDLLDKAQGKLHEDLTDLQKLKDEEEGPNAGPLQSWDVSYYSTKYKATLGVNEAKIREYFPLEHVKHEILSTYQNLLGLTFARVDAEVWHEEVECYSVREAGGEQQVLGFFYLDLFPRPGKYAHQCVYPLRPAFEDGDDVVTAACVNIGNLSKPGADGKPALLRFREVETFFHEFGHVMHCVLSKSKYSVHAWAWSAVPWPGGVEQDFLEVPSMMLENFVWQPEVLRRLSKHYETGDSLPEDDIDALSASRGALEGYARSRFISMALFDLAVHGGPGPYEFEGEKHDTIDFYNVITESLSKIPSVEGAFPAASWYHPMMGYAAGYYGYLWSEAFAADLFSEFEAKKPNVCDPALGRKYRETILSPCATVDGDSMLQNFLGRGASLDPFLKRMGVLT